MTNREGSPPHGRGKVHNLGYEYTYLRITPAWAGKSSASNQVHPDERDHPRVGGEKMCIVLCA